MSKRNSQEAKRAARERLQAEREKQARRDRIRRQSIVGVSVIAVLAAATGIGFAVTKMNEPTGWEAAKSQKLVKPAHTAGKNGTDIVVGDGKTAKRVDAFEDMRCPACASFEQAAGAALQKGAEQGKYKLHVHIGDLIDSGPAGGEGSKDALSAMGAALNVSKSAFMDYRTQLYSAKNHPEETEDTFAKDAYLLKVANSVPQLKGNKKFEQAVRKGTYDKWTLSMVSAFNKAKISQTPTIKINGKEVDQKQVPAQLQKLGVDLGSLKK